MAIALDSKSDLSSSGSTSYTVSFTNTGGNILFVSIYAINATVSGVSYAGVAMTQIAHITYVGDLQVYALGGGWGTGSPATGANNVVVTAAGGTTYRVNAISYSGAATSGQPDVTPVTTTGNIGGNTAASQSITTATNNAMMVLFSKTGDDNPAGTVTGGTNQLSGTAPDVSDNLTTTAGTYTITITNPGDGPSRAYDGFLLALTPAGSSPSATIVTNNLSLLGVGT